jgi:PmbA protein
LRERAEQLVAAALKAGADAADAVAVRGMSLGVDVRLGALEETERSESDDFGLRVFVGKRHASIGANVIGDPAALAERAVAMARVAPEDRVAGLADPALLTRQFADLDLVDATVPTTRDLIERATAAEDAARAVAGVTNSGGAHAGWSLGGLVLVTSHGFSGAYLASRHTLSVTAVAGSGTGMERDYDGSSKIHLADLDDPETVGRTAGERAVKRLNPRKLPTQKAHIVWDRRAAVSLLGHLSGAINGAAIARKTSFLKDKMGQAILPKGVTITDDPTRKRGLGSKPFDGEGLAALPLTIVEDGVLNHWFLDSSTGRELGLASNGRAARGTGSPSPSSTNLTLLPGPETRDALLKSIGTGLYVTDMIGSGVNGITGDYSRGASGFWIENGELTYPVSEVTIAGNLIDMFARLRVADDLIYRYSMNAPTVAVEDLTLAGK